MNMSEVAIVTGGSKGIGLAIVEKLANQGYKVYNLDIVTSDIGEYRHCDVRDVASVQRVIADICEREERVDVLVCNAGIHRSANIEQTSEAMLDEVIALNIKGAFAATQSVLPLMREAKRGSIVYISSDQALVGKRNSFAYNLSKAALASMTKTTALDYAEFGIRANAVCPGTIETPLFHSAIDNFCASTGADKDAVVAEESALQPLGRLGQPEDVANLVAFLVSEEAGFITGSLQVIDGGYTAQ